MFDKTALPNPPEFPASNASYNKLVGAMHKAVLSATTCAAAIAAVQEISDGVKGVNTYARATRRYGETLLTALNNLDPKAQREALALDGPAKALKAERDAQVGPEVSDALDIVEAAKNGDPVADFMLKGQRAQKAVDDTLAEAIAEAETVTIIPIKAFFDKSNAKRGMKRASVDHLPVKRWVQEGDEHRIRPILQVDDVKGQVYCAERGFEAEIGG